MPASTCFAPQHSTEAAIYGSSEWVAQTNKTCDGVLKYTKPGALSGNVSKAPDVTIQSFFTGTQGFSTIAYDDNDNLWVASITEFYKFSNASSLSGLVQQSPAATVTVSSSSDLGNMAFDEQGSLWIVDWGAGAIQSYANPNSLTGTITPQPNVRLTGEGSLGFAIAFDPVPSSVPLGR